MSFASDIGRMVAGGPKRGMRHEESMVLLKLLGIAQEPEDEQIRFYQEILKGSFLLKIMDTRFRACIGENVQISPILMVWLSTLADRPGFAVLLVAVLAHAVAEGRELTVNSLVNWYFSEGIPTPEAYQLAWEAQKVTPERLAQLNLGAMSGDNLLDQPEAWL